MYTKKTWDTEQYMSLILSGNMPALSKAITLIESNHPNHASQAKEIIKACLPYTGNSIRIGITGVPGVGKSTFIESFGNLLTQQGKKVAVLAIDPSSSLNKGSILGDKTRMETLVQNPNVYIRPSATGDTLGGVSKKTRESILLCETAGYNVILIETVGVGQSETVVHSMVDFFLLLKLANAGDEIQGIKRGIMELCDGIAINKADGASKNEALIAKHNFENALHLFALKNNQWSPKVFTCSAIENKGILEIWEMITSFESITKNNGSFFEKRNQQDTFWFYDTLERALKNVFYSNEIIQQELSKQLIMLENKETTPFEAASYLIDLYQKNNE